VVVNVTGGAPVGSTSNDTATFGNFTYTFTSFGTTPATFYGAGSHVSGTDYGTSYFAGSVADVFEGTGNPADVLSFLDASGNALTITVGSSFACPARGTALTDPAFGVAQLGSVTEKF